LNRSVSLAREEASGIASSAGQARRDSQAIRANYRPGEYR
jgi:hypothetical protein